MPHLIHRLNRLQIVSGDKRIDSQCILKPYFCVLLEEKEIQFIR